MISNEGATVIGLSLDSKGLQVSIGACNVVVICPTKLGNNCITGRLPIEALAIKKKHLSKFVAEVFDGLRWDEAALIPDRRTSMLSG